MLFNRLTRCLIVILFQVVSIQAYILSENETSWDDVVCTNGTIATIDLQDLKLDVTLGDSTYRINDENSRLPTDMTSAWVGYYQIPVGFEYIGCVDTIDITPTDVIIKPINGDPGHCFLGCSDVSIVGVNNEDCYCLDEKFDEIIKTDSDHCSAECESLPGVACGRIMSSVRRSLSIYRRNNNVTSINKYDGNCLSVEPQADEYQWQACTESLEVQCLIDGVIRQYGQDALQWYKAGRECIKPGSKPLPYFEDKSKIQLVKTVSRIWTGVFKTYAIFKVSNKSPPEWVNLTSPDLRFGVLEYNTTGEYHYLHFVERGNNLTKALCNNGVTTSSTIRTTSPDDKTTTTISPIDPSTANSTFSGGNTEQPTTNDDTLMIGVITGVCSFVAIVIIIVSIILVKRKYFRSVTKEQTGRADVTSGSGNGNQAYDVVGGHQREASACNNLDVELSSNPQIGNQSDDIPNISQFMFGSDEYSAEIPHMFGSDEYSSVIISS